MGITVAEIGRMAGVSTATVSRALNDSGSVSPKAREAIAKVLRETRYVHRRNIAARKHAATPAKPGGLVEIVFHRHSPVETLSVSGSSLALGPLDSLPSTGLNNEAHRLGLSFHRRVIEGAVAELTKWQCKTVLRLNSDLLDPQFLADMNKPDKQGVLLVGEYSPDMQKFIEQCQHPLVLVDFIHNTLHDVVTIDNLGGIFQAFNHLYELGHRKLGFVGARKDVTAYMERFAAFRLKMAEAGLAMNPDWVYCGPDHIQQVADDMRSILTKSDRPTGLVCANDCYALGVIRAASNLGISIPQHLSVVGFDDTEVGAMVTPALTTICVPQFQMGQQAARQLMIAIQVDAPERTHGCETRVKTSLVRRQSTAAVSQ
jgi:LacI family transcriptional regulator